MKTEVSQNINNHKEGAKRAGAARFDATDLSTYQKLADTGGFQKYGITKKELIYYRNKILYQREFLQNNHFITAQGQVKTLLEISFSANHSERYYYQLTNKINTLNDYAFENDLQPVFITVTLDSYFRDFHKGDYTRFKSLKEKTQERVLSGVPNNDRFGYIKDKINNNETLSIKELYQCLNFQMRRYFKSYAFKRMKKENKTYVYIRTIEPHKDGIPHLHMLLYIDKTYHETLKDSYKSYFPAPQNMRKLSNTTNDIQGFQAAVKNPAGYILKYITKTFSNMREKKEIGYMQAWFIKHKIIRCITSHSIVPQWVYQKMMVFQKDWHMLDTIVKESHKEWDSERNYILIDASNGISYEYDNGRYRIFYENSVIKEHGEKKPEKFLATAHIPKYNKQEKHKTRIFIDNSEFIQKKDDLVEIKKRAYQLSDMELYSYYVSLDVESVDMNHFGYVKNLCIERGLVDGEILPLSEYREIINVGEGYDT